MALLFMDGFGHMDDGYEDYGKWDNSTGFNYTTTDGRTGGYGVLLGNIVEKSFPNTSEVIIGFAMYLGSLNDSLPILKFEDGVTSQLSIRCTTDGSIKAYRGSSTLLGSSSPGVCVVGQWDYIEFKVVFNGTTGSVEAVLNGTTVLTLTGINTISTANAYFNNIILDDVIYRIDDLYVCDTTGTVNNDFLGDVTITALYPTSDGTNSDFTPSSGVDNYLMVDDPQITNGTTYNISETVGHKDSFGMTTSAAEGDILGVQIAMIAGSATGGVINAQTLMISGGTPTETLGTSTGLSVTPATLLEIYDEEPVDSATWTNAIINASEFGVKVES